MIFISAIIILILGIPLVKVMLVSQVINGILLPLILICMLLLINNKKIMGDYTNSGFFNILTWGTSILLIVLTLSMIITTLFPNIL